MVAAVYISFSAPSCIRTNESLTDNDNHAGTPTFLDDASRDILSYTDRM